MTMQPYVPTLKRVAASLSLFTGGCGREGGGNWREMARIIAMSVLMTAALSA